MLRSPALSAEHLAFVYAGEIWIAGRDGKSARRLTSATGEEGEPVFSPDGRWLAFNASYEGNADVYVVPAEGGVPTRLTYHPGPDQVQGFTADSAQVLFISPRTVFTRWHRHLDTVQPARLFRKHCRHADHPDRGSVARWQGRSHGDRGARSQRRGASSACGPLPMTQMSSSTFSRSLTKLLLTVKPSMSTHSDFSRCLSGPPMATCWMPRTRKGFMTTATSSTSSPARQRCRAGMRARK